MPDIKLLDCTLRDGGYVNDWEFGHNNLIQIYERLCDSGVEAIELGFIDDRRPFDINRSIFPDTASIGRIWESARKQPSIRLGMIDYGTCDIRHIEPAEKSYINAIRVIFKEHLMQEALDYCSQLIDLGYIVCAQLVSVTTYTDESMRKLIDIVNRVRPYALSMVDTYGLLDPMKLLHIDRIIDSNLADGIRIGFHGHNNMQLAYANSIAFLGADHRHDLIVDGTLYGMGKSAGNAPIELLAKHLNEYYGKNYDIDPMLESIEESVMDYYARSPWGYKMFFYLSSKNTCHPSYVSDYQKTENMSMTGLDQVLSRIEPPEKKLLYDKDISRDNYKCFIEEDSDETYTIDRIKEACDKRDLLLVGPGKNIRLQAEKVQDYVRTHDPVVISVNYIPDDLKVDFVFVTNRYRYQQMTDDLHEVRNKDIVLIATSNVRSVKGIDTLYVNRAPLLDVQEKIKDNSLLMLLQILQRSKIRRVALAGFDGYSNKEDNYFNNKMEYSFVKDNADHLNHQMREAIRGPYSDIEFEFVTYSHYEEEEDSHFAAF